MSFNWILSNASHEYEDGGTSVVQRLVCAETGVTYRLRVERGKPLSLELEGEEIINSEVAKSLWLQLADIQTNIYIKKMMREAVGE